MGVVGLWNRGIVGAWRPVRGAVVAHPRVGAGPRMGAGALQFVLGARLRHARVRHRKRRPIDRAARRSVRGLRAGDSRPCEKDPGGAAKHAKPPRKANVRQAALRLRRA